MFVYIIGWAYQDSRHPVLSTPKGNSKFDILLVKNTQSKTKKQNQILPVTIKKIKFLLFKKTVYGSFRQRITIGKRKTKVIHTDLGTFRHNQTYPRIIQAYSGIFRVRDIQNPRYIQKPAKHLR